MNKKKFLQIGGLILVIVLIASLAELTQDEIDPCANPQADISGAILADNPEDQDALANRAIIMQAQCEGRSAKTQEVQAVSAGFALNEDTKIALPSSEQTPPLPKTVQVSSAPEIMQYRCMVCHGCYDAPCQLKLEAHRGLVRGASKDVVYDSSRLRDGNLTRLFDDALSEQGWRDKGFYSILDPNQPQQGVMYRMLDLKQKHPLPAEGKIPEGFDFSLYRDQQCPKQDEFDQFASENPLWGMPYGFPGLNKDEHRTLTHWLQQGALEPLAGPLDDELQLAFDNWERFLNGDSLQQQLASRYLYEHLFLASIYLRKDSNIRWFRLVRSATPPGKDLDLIATRRPYDDPGVERVYYRLQAMPATPLAKNHIPYRWDQQRLDLYHELFLEAGPAPEKLPGYEPEVASNPFRSFIDIPVESRYRFLLEEAQFTIMNFIKGPVCRGQVALNVINDHFWVLFANPNRMDPVTDAEFLAEEMDNLRLPSPKTGTVIDLLQWRKYAKAQEKYQSARSRQIRKQLSKGLRLQLESIWDGDGRNANASLTVFRHFDTASVEKGLVGSNPKTAWVIDYPLLERIHYLLVAGYDVYGAASHQLVSRLYMDFLRMEAEFNFLLFMPSEKRIEMHDYWYRNARKGTHDHFAKRSALSATTFDHTYQTDDPMTEFFAVMGQRIYGARDHRYVYRDKAPRSTVDILEQLDASRGIHNSFLPHVSFINVVSGSRDEVYSLVRNAAHSNIAQPFREAKNRLPEEDTLTVVRGFIGAYPNYFFQVNEKELAQFANDVEALGSEEDYHALLARYGVRRNASWFWRLSDKLHARYREQDNVEYGVMDYNRYLGL